MSTARKPGADKKASRERESGSSRRWIVLLSLLAILLVFGAPWALREYRLRGVRDALRERNTPLAIERLTELIKSSPRDAELKFLLARAYRRSGRFDEMFTLLKSAGLLGFPPDKLQRESTLAMAQAGRMSEAVPELERMLLNPGDDGPDICEAFVTGYFHLFQIEPARRLLDAWERDYPQDGQPHYYRGKLLENSNEWVEAAREYRRGVDLSPASLEIRRNLANALVRSNEYFTAASEFERCLKQSPRDVAAHVGLARSLRGLNKPDEARKHLRQALEIDAGSAEAENLLGQVELDAGNSAAALELLRASVRREPRNPDFRYALAGALKAAGEEDEASEQFQFIDKANSAQQKIKNAMVLLSSRKGDANARETLGLRVEVGRLEIEFGSPADGVTWLKGALEIDPDYVPAHAALADYYAKTGDEPAALEHRRKAGGSPAKSAE